MPFLLDKKQRLVADGTGRPDRLPRSNDPRRRGIIGGNRRGHDKQQDSNDWIKLFHVYSLISVRVRVCSSFRFFSARLRINSQRLIAALSFTMRLFLFDIRDRMIDHLQNTHRTEQPGGEQLALLGVFGHAGPRITLLCGQKRVADQSVGPQVHHIDFQMNSNR
jgi:hypothetical protein